MLIALPDKYIVYDFDYREVISTRPLPKEGANRDYHPETGHVAYTIRQQSVCGRSGRNQRTGRYRMRQSVHRNEFGIKKGTSGVPRAICSAILSDGSKYGSPISLVDVTAPIAEVNNIRYPMAGMTSHQVKVGIYNPATGKSIYLNAGDPTDRYFTNISWRRMKRAFI